MLVLIERVQYWKLVCVCVCMCVSMGACACVIGGGIEAAGAAMAAPLFS